MEPSVENDSQVGVLPHRSKRRRPPQRKTVDLNAWVPDYVRDRAIQKAEWLANQDKAEAEARGIELPLRNQKRNLSAYITDLILADTPNKEALAGRLPAVLGHRCVVGLEVVIEQVRVLEIARLAATKGDADAIEQVAKLLASILGELKDLRWDIVAVLEDLRRPYDTALELIGETPWDGMST